MLTNKRYINLLLLAFIFVMLGFAIAADNIYKKMEIKQAELEKQTKASDVEVTPLETRE